MKKSRAYLQLILRNISYFIPPRLGIWKMATFKITIFSTFKTSFQQLSVQVVRQSVKNNSVQL